jgi:hypothetical protein
MDQWPLVEGLVAADAVTPADVAAALAESFDALAHDR